MSKPKRMVVLWLPVAAMVMLCFGAFFIQAASHDASTEPVETSQQIKAKPKFFAPDLIVESIAKKVLKTSVILDYTIPPTKKIDYQVIVRVKNIGKAKAGAFKVGVESQPVTHAGGGPFKKAAELICKGLDPGATMDLLVPETFSDISGPSTAPVDIKWFCFRAGADTANEVKESNEKNNTLAMTNCKQY